MSTAMLRFGAVEFAGMLLLITFGQGNKGAVGKAELLIERAACRSGS
jgi:hypothetical protein